MYCSETVPIYKKKAKIGEIDSVRSIFNLIYLVEILQIKSEAIGAVFIFSFKDRRYYPKSNKEPTMKHRCTVISFGIAFINCVSKRKSKIHKFRVKDVYN